MDAGLAAAAKALRAGDPLGALPRVALRQDAAALALRGIAMAQVGDLRRARALLRAAARAFGPDAPLARARCLLAQAEVALAARDLARWPEEAIVSAARALARAGDRANALHARLLLARRLLLAGRVGEAGRTVAALDLSRGSAAHRTLAALLAFEVALRRGRSAAARSALGRARSAAAQAAIPALRAEVDRAGAALERPAARLAGPGRQRPLSLAEAERIRASGSLVVDARRRTITAPGRSLDLATRPVLFALARHLAEAWPREAPRGSLVQRAFGASRATPSLRGRLRVDVGRLRRALAGLAGVCATAGGFALVPAGGAGVAVLAPPEEGEDGALLALLADGEPWSTSALALALGASARTVQRALVRLSERGRARAAGRGRGQRWLLPVPEGITLVLPVPPPGAAG